MGTRIGFAVNVICFKCAYCRLLHLYSRDSGSAAYCASSSLELEACEYAMQPIVSHFLFRPIVEGLCGAWAKSFLSLGRSDEVDGRWHHFLFPCPLDLTPNSVEGDSSAASSEQQK